MVTGLVTQTDPTRHDTGPGHPERSERVTAVVERLRASGLTQSCARIVAGPAAIADLERVHSERHVRAMQRAIEAGARVLDEGDTRASAGSWQAALESAGGAVLAA